MNKKIKISIIVIIWLILIASIVYFLNKDKSNWLIWTIIKEENYSDDLFEDTQEEIPEIDSLRSNVRLLCKMWKTETLLWSSSFIILKQKIDNIWEKQEDNFKFLYVTIPQLVMDECMDKDQIFIDLLIKYLQAEDIDMIKQDKINNTEYNSYVDNISFNNENIEKERLKTDKEYFEEVLFDENLESIKASYFSEYMFNWSSPDKFFNTFSILSLQETNEILDQTIWNFEDFVKDLWFEWWIEDLRTQMLTNLWLNNVEELKKLMISDYESLAQELKNKYKIELNEELSSAKNTLNFYKNNYIKIKQDSETFALINELWKKYLYFAIINDDYADWLDEQWSWLENFWNSIVWNALAKIWYIYLYDSQKK